MSYKTYTTDAIVCGTYDRNTSDRSYRLFTQDLGMVWAQARSVRMEKSRQRMALSDFSMVRVSLVRGKTGWKIGSIQPQGNVYHNAPDQASRGSVVAIIRWLIRYVRGEEMQEELYVFVVAALRAATTSHTDRVWFDACVALRLFSLAGYVSNKEIPTHILVADPIEFTKMSEPELLPKMQELCRNAAAASQL